MQTFYNRSEVNNHQACSRYVSGLHEKHESIYVQMCKSVHGYKFVYPELFRIV